MCVSSHLSCVMLFDGVKHATVKAFLPDSIDPASHIGRRIDVGVFWSRPRSDRGDFVIIFFLIAFTYQGSHLPTRPYLRGQRSDGGAEQSTPNVSLSSFPHPSLPPSSSRSITAALLLMSFRVHCGFIDKWQLYQSRSLNFASCNLFVEECCLKQISAV